MDTTAALAERSSLVSSPLAMILLALAVLGIFLGVAYLRKRSRDRDAETRTVRLGGALDQRETPRDRAKKSPSSY